MQFYLFGSNPAIASYPMTVGSFDTKREAKQARRKCKDAGWSNLKIKKLDWL
jgi:hypothetical protein